MRLIRRAAAALLDATCLWYLLPGRAQGAICNCPICRGADQPANDQ